MTTHDDEFGNDLEQEIAELRRKVPDISDLNIRRLRQQRASGPKLTVGKRVAKLEKRMVELEVEVERLRSMVRKLDDTNDTI